MILTANRWGKSFCGAHEALAHVYGYRFWEVKGLKLVDGDLPPRNSIPMEHWVMRSDGLPVRVPNNGMCVTGLNTTRGIGQVIYPAIRNALPPSVLQRKEFHTYMDAQAPKRTQFPNGSRLDYGSKEQSREQFEGFMLDWAWVDEPVPRWLYNGLWTRLLDKCGPLWFTLTPLGTDALWLMDWVEDSAVWKIMGGVQTDNPYLSPDAIQEFQREGKWTKAEERARLHGEFECIGRRVLENFDEAVHLTKPFSPPDDWVFGQTVDPHHSKPAFVLWWAVDPATEPDWVYHFYREWPNDDFFQMEGGGKSPTEYAILFRQIEGRKPADIRLCDPRFGKAEWRTLGGERTVWVEEMEKAGLYYIADIHGVGRLETGHMKLTEMFRWDRNHPISPTNTPKIFITKDCPNLIRAVKNYSYQEVRDPEKGIVEKVSEQYKDPIDTLRYTVLFEIPSIAMEHSGFRDADFVRENQSDEW